VNPAILPPTIKRAADLRYDPPECAEYGGHHAEAHLGPAWSGPRAGGLPQATASSPARADRPLHADSVKATSTGSAMMIWPRIIALRVNSKVQRPENTLPRQQQIENQPDHHRGRGEQALV